MMGSSVETVGALLHPKDVASSVEKATSSLISNHVSVTAERSPSKNDAASKKEQPDSPTQSEEKKQKAQGTMQALAATKPRSVLQAKWDEMFNRLLAYKATYGDCLVPNRYDEDPSLGAWVSTQRRQYKVLISGSCESTPMNPDRAKRLEAVGFVWSTTDPRHVPWETRYHELIDFKEQHGNCLVPIGYKENIKLANWVSTQRQEAKLQKQGRSCRLTSDRIKSLDAIGFVWEAQRGGSRKRKNKDSFDDGDNVDDEQDEGKKRAPAVTNNPPLRRKRRKKLVLKPSENPALADNEDDSSSHQESSSYHSSDTSIMQAAIRSSAVRESLRIEPTLSAASNTNFLIGTRQVANMVQELLPVRGGGPAIGAAASRLRFAAPGGMNPLGSFGGIMSGGFGAYGGYGFGFLGRGNDVFAGGRLDHTAYRSAAASLAGSSAARQNHFTASNNSMFHHPGISPFFNEALLAATRSGGGLGANSGIVYAEILRGIGSGVHRNRADVEDVFSAAISRLRNPEIDMMDTRLVDLLYRSQGLGQQEAGLAGLLRRHHVETTTPASSQQEQSVSNRMTSEAANGRDDKDEHQPDEY